MSHRCLGMLRRRALPSADASWITRGLSATRHVHHGLLGVVTVLLAVAFPPAPAAGQSADASPSPRTRTAWGDPDLQGIWTSSTYTPLERPDNLAGRQFLTDEEVAALNELLTVDGVDPLRARSVLAADTDAERLELTRQTRENIHYDNAVWLTEEQPRQLSTRRTSLIVDPPDGKIPPLTPEAERREAERRKASRWLVYNISPQSFDSYATRTLQERCLVWRHGGPPMLPASYNDLLQIFQTEDYVVIMQEMRANDARIVPLDGRPHLPSTIRQWPGDSRGHWEGDTLVVDTLNFNEKIHFNGSSEALHVVERFTRVDAETIRYEFTADDPTSWTSAWSAEFPLMKREGPLFEYACHEGNHDISNILEIARNLDRAAGSTEGSRVASQSATATPSTATMKFTFKAPSRSFFAS